MISWGGLPSQYLYEKEEIVTILQKEMAERSRAIETIGYRMAAGLATITSENESAIQRGLSALLEANEHAEAIAPYSFLLMTEQGAVYGPCAVFPGRAVFA